MFQLVAPLLVILSLMSVVGNLPALHGTAAAGTVHATAGLPLASTCYWQAPEGTPATWHAALHRNNQTPTPPPDQSTRRQPVGIAIALTCLFVLSTLSIVGSVALKRRFDSINPD
jgi:hypothetical protein